METFDITGALPTGITLLEASAGTGKTWTVAALVTKLRRRRRASPSTRCSSITFSRAASQELRERVRAQLDEAVQRPRRAASREPDNRLHEWLLTRRRGRARAPAAAADRRAGLVRRGHHRDHPPVLPARAAQPRRGRRHRLRRDPGRGPRAAGVRGRRRPLPRPLRWRGRRRRGPRTQALDLAREVVGDPRAVVEPRRRTHRGVRLACGDAGPLRRRGASTRSSAASAASACSVLRRPPRPARRRARGDDDAPARARMRRRWKFVLIDEFQDTDPMQWQVSSGRSPTTPRWC